ncbi:GAP family protein [Lysinibacillus sphaericus]|uniref:GAP family protein n=1 Tax=Lysinibacillus sphaericus TaxID=1421 RepID=UPI001C5DFC81
MTTDMLLFIGALAILDMFSPAIIGVTVYILLVAKRQQITLICTYLATVALFYFVTGIFLMFGLDVVFAPVVDVLSTNAAKTILTVIGAILFIGSWFVPKKKTTGPPKPKSFRAGAMVALGLSTSLLEVATALPYFAAIGIMTSSSKLALFEWLPIIAVYNLIMVSPALILLCLHIIFRRFMHRPLLKLQAAFDKSTSSALSWIMFIVGLIMLMNGGILS